VIINVSDTFAAAMVYVMLSRVYALSQIYILDKFIESKMYPNPKALEELERLNKISQNENPSEWEKEGIDGLKISSLNCRSLNKHYQDILSDENLLKSDIITLQETWLLNDTVLEDLDIPGFTLHLNSSGRGKGIATYFKENIFSYDKDIKQEHMQLSKFTSSNLDVINLYRSHNGDFKELNHNLDNMIEKVKSQLVVGDFNFCYLDSSSNSTRQYFRRNNFEQLIKEPTHIEGNLLDHGQIRNIKGDLRCTVQLHSKYYTDHKGLAIIVKKRMLIKYSLAN
jgi:exonuclease III